MVRVDEVIIGIGEERRALARRFPLAGGLDVRGELGSAGYES